MNFCRAFVPATHYREVFMLKFLYPDGTHCYRALHTVHAVFRNDAGKLIARAEKGDLSGMYEFEITGFELLAPSVVYD